MGTLPDDRVLRLVRLRNGDLVTANIQVGSRLAAVTISIGKMLLPSLDDAELERCLSERPFAGAAGPNAIGPLDELRDALAGIRRRGWVAQGEELAYGLRSVAAPVTDAVGMAAPARGLPVERLVAELCPVLQSACGEVSRLHGGRRGAGQTSVRPPST
ncbi:IclR family transcriptional regulator domain-containing protein [Streptomyces sp. DSM 15324]|uniref:IclR family transcriptional regulator domain-containing protein n=1 Tax=Streptomyces sp. DSM 15324 TaxID=1739111 RepID=UPI0007488B13|nr:IclR family transcriptional regulator C-terminal domain-containing protein [Streptomyces sp. DSM 15324]KUO10327.1 hypothetical protein AQJ58_20430 [Streptomyces sp. DSM 15324]